MTFSGFTLPMKIVKLSSKAALPDSVASLGATLNAEATELHYTEKAGQMSAGDVLKAVYGAGLPVQDVETRHSRLEDILIQVLHAQDRRA